MDLKEKEYLKDLYKIDKGSKVVVNIGVLFLIMLVPTIFGFREVLYDCIRIFFNPLIMLIFIVFPLIIYGFYGSFNKKSRKYEYPPIPYAYNGLITKMDGIDDVRAEPVKIDEFKAMLLMTCKVVETNDFLSFVLDCMEKKGKIIVKKDKVIIKSSESDNSIESHMFLKIKESNGYIFDKRFGYYYSFTSANYVDRNFFKENLLDSKYFKIIPGRNPGIRTTEKAHETVLEIIKHMNYLDSKGGLYTTYPYNLLLKSKKEY